MRLLKQLRKINREIALAICIAALLAWCTAALADEADQLFFNANRLYEGGDYKGAIGEYNKIIAMGLESGNLYYNLGNSYFKTDQIPEAILSYRRASKLMPRDGDLEANLRYAELSIEDKFSPPHMNIFMKSLNRFCASMTVREITLLSSSILFIFWIVVIGALLLRKIRDILRKVAFAILVLFLLFLSLTVYKVWSEDIRQEGVIVQSRVAVRYSPTEDGTVAFNLHKGSTVRIIRRRNGWCQISVPGEKSGWIKAEALRPVRNPFFDTSKMHLVDVKVKPVPTEEAPKKPFGTTK